MDSVEAVFVPKIFGSLGKGAASAQALQRAEITMIDGPTLYLRHPFFWAAMMLERQ
jgi:CHAT domain-containing protein